VVRGDSAIGRLGQGQIQAQYPVWRMGTKVREEKTPGLGEVMESMEGLSVGTEGEAQW
jgi:hypothetical protein